MALYGLGMTKKHFEDLQIALRLADTADQVSMDRFQALDLKVEEKPDFTLVSDADKAVEAAIREQLAASRPQDAILGEEEGEQGTSTRRWIIDPIDGTHNYVRGVPVWATLIGLEEDGEMVIGVVSAPALSRRWWATIGGGAFVSSPGQEAKQLQVSGVEKVSDAFFSYSSFDGWVDSGRGEAFFDFQASCWRARAFGDFWSYMMVAEGVVDVAAEPELALYDMAALVPIVTEAGGRFSDLDGSDGPWGPNGLATNALLHDAAVSALG